MPTLGAPLDFATYEARSLRAHQLGAAPSSPVTGQLYYNTADNTLYWRDNIGWVSGRGLTIPLGQNLLFAPDATYDIGAVATNRPRSIYATSGIVAGSAGTSVTIGQASPGVYIAGAAGGSMVLGVNGADRWYIDYNGGHLTPNTDAAIDIGNTLPVRRVRSLYLSNFAQIAGITTPANPPAGSFKFYPKSDGNFYRLDSAGNESVFSVGGATPPATTTTQGIIQLAGDLTGTAASPQIAAGVITDADVNAANKDGAVGTASMRTLGSGAAQAMPGNRTLDAIALPTGPVAYNGQRITGLADPASPQDASTKNYVDATVQGLDVKQSVRLASTANISISSAPTTLDGVTLVLGDRILLKDQTTPSENGLWIFNVAGLGLTRTPDADISAEVTSGMYTFVEEGTVNADSGWTLTTNNPIVLGTTGLTFAQFSGAGSVVAGAGLTKTGNTLDVIGTTNRISVAADSIDISATYVGQTSITTLGTITAGTWNGTAIGLANGGTGQTTAKAARESGLLSAGYYSSATHGAGTTISIPQATHLLRATRGLVVQAQIEATGEMVLPDMVVAANGDVTITFGLSQTANTIRATIIG